jgi:hypothetical protein
LAHVTDKSKEICISSVIFEFIFNFDPTER